MSDKATIQRLTSTTNSAVVQLPERQFPGVVIQGDSLHNLSVLAQEVADQIKKCDYDEALGVADELKSLLQAYLSSYEDAVGGAAAKLPY